MRQKVQPTINSQPATRCQRFGGVVLPMLITLIIVSSCARTGVTSAPPIDRGIALDAQLLQMIDRRIQDTIVVDAVLADSSAARRTRGALSIGNVKIRARYGVLRRLLTDVDTAVAASAAYALGVAKDSGALPALARAVAGAPDAVAREAAWSLGELGEASREVLVLALGSSDVPLRTNSAAAQRSPTVRAALLLASAKLRPVPVSVVTPWLADTSSETVRAAAYAIGRSRVPGGVRALLSVRAHRDEETRQHVARGLAKEAAGDSLASAARDALLVLLRDGSARVRVNAARSLGSFGPSILRDLEKALGDPDANVRVAASEMAKAVFARDTMAWKRAWEADTTFRVRQQLLLGARGAGVSALASGEIAWSRHPDWRRRLAALEARGDDGKADRLALGREFARDVDPRVRASALRLLPTSGNDSLIRVLATSALADGDMSVRAAGLGLLTPRARADDVLRALTAHARAHSDVEDDARIASLRLIASAWRRDSTRVDSAARRRMLAFAGTGTTRERQLVGSVTPMRVWAKTPADRPARALKEYEKIASDWLVPGARLPRAVIKTDHGDITLELFAADAPLVVEAFVKLAKEGFYRNTTFHRVVPNFVVQDGDPRGDGGGGAGFALRDSPSRRRHERGALGLATSGPDTGGSQYYLCHATQPHLDGGYTVFGRVVDGMAVMDAIVQGDRMLRIDIK